MKIESIAIKTLSLDETLPVSNITGLKVLSNTGFVVGHVKEVQLNLNANKVEGILVKRLWKSPLLIGREYIERVSSSGVFLSIFPSILWKKKPVLTASGRLIGRIKEIKRKNSSNEIESIVIKSRFKKDIEISATAVKTWGKSVVLKNSYNVKQKYFWQKS